MLSDNCYYELDGGPRKIGGADKINETATGSLNGIYDAWFQGGAGSETQKQVAYAGTTIQNMSALGGTWTSLKTGLEADKIPCFEMMNDVVVMASTSTVDVPQSWDGGAASTSDLGGSPPNFSIVVEHRNRLWAAGVASNPSRLYYTALLTTNDWTTPSDAGSIDISPSDGDRITGLASHKNELIVFKGTNKQSIHRITGSAPTGTDAFARVPFITGVSAVSQLSIFRVGDDLVFASPRGIHSLAATASFGDYVEAFLSRPLLTFYQDKLNHNVLNGCQGVNYQSRGLAIWTFAPSGSTTRSLYMCYDYRFSPGRWSTWGYQTRYVNAHSLMVAQTGRKHRLYAGTSTGFLYELDKTTRAVDTTGAYTWNVMTPYLNFGSSGIMKNAEDGFLSLQPKGAYNLTMGYQRDTQTQQTVTVSQAGGNTLG